MTSQTMQPIEWIDTHCHVYEETIPGGADGALQAARDAGVTTMIVIGTDATTTQQAIAIAAAHSDVWATVGLHPHDAKLGLDTVLPFVDAPRVASANVVLTFSTIIQIAMCNAMCLLHK
jgi:Tat protein secretion system quality control protein TatD with DNase activity